MPAAAAKVPPTQPVLRCVGETVPLCRDGRALYTPCCMELMQVHPSLVMQGVCGTGDYYCRQGNCAGGACLGTPVVYDSQPLVAAAQSPPPSPVRRPPPPVRRPPPPTLKPMGECKARQIQHGCYQVSMPAALYAPRLRLHASRAPNTRHMCNALAVACGAVQQNTDFYGADLPRGVVNNVGSASACCSACTARQDCGSWTYVRSGRVCYLKHASGFTRKVRTGMKSALMSGRAAPLSPPPRPPSPAPPKPPQPRPPPPQPVPRPGPPPPAPGPSGPYQFVEMTQDQKRRMYQLTSIFENADVRFAGMVDCRVWLGCGHQRTASMTCTPLHPFHAIHVVPADGAAIRLRREVERWARCAREGSSTKCVACCCAGGGCSSSCQL